MGLIEEIDAQHSQAAAAMSLVQQREKGSPFPRNGYLEEAKQLADESQLATLNAAEGDDATEDAIFDGKIAQSHLLGKLELEKSLHMFETNRHIEGIPAPPVSVQEMKQVADMNRRQYQEWRRTEPHMCYQIIKWAKDLVVMIYTHMKDCLVAALRETQALINAKDTAVEALQQLEQVRLGINSVIQTMLSTAQCLKVELEAFETEIKDNSRMDGQFIRNRRDALFLRHRMTTLKQNFRKFNQEFLAALSKATEDQADKYNKIVEDFRKKQQEERGKGGLVAQMQRNLKGSLAILGAGSAAVIGLIAVGVCIFLNVITGGIAIGLCLATVALGSIGGGALGYLVGHSAQERLDECKESLDKVVKEMSRMSNLFGTLRNAVDMVVCSFAAVERQIELLVCTASARLVYFENTRAVAEWTDEDWADRGKVTELMKEIAGNDAWGDEMDMQRGETGIPQVSFDRLLETVNAAKQKLDDFAISMEELLKKNKEAQQDFCSSTVE